MEKVNGLLCLYKKLGESPLDTISRYKKENPEYMDVPMTYAGRLDPMAEGLLLVLSGDAVHEKEKYLDLPKTYTFQILWGFETDTLDLLGLQTENSQRLYFEKELATLDGGSSRNFSAEKYPCPSRDIVSEDLISGKLNQEYPAYSSKPINGKPLFEWAREGKLNEIEIPKHEVEIYDAVFVSRKTISKEDLRKSIIEKIGKVSGDFRQKEILDKWNEVLENTKESEFFIDEISMKVSSGFYVRQFVSDLAKKLGAVATTFHIKRIKIGDFMT